MSCSYTSPLLFKQSYANYYWCTSHLQLYHIKKLDNTKKNGAFNQCGSKVGPVGCPRVVVSTAAFHARVRGSVPGLGGLKETKMFLPQPRVKVSIVGSLRDREVACSASDRQGSNLASCVWRTVSSQSSHHPQEVLLAQFSLYVHKGGLKPIHFISFHFIWVNSKTWYGRPRWLIRTGHGSKLRGIGFESRWADVCHWGCAYTVFQTVQRKRW